MLKIGYKLPKLARFEDIAFRRFAAEP